ncbi:MAG: dependent oxidoreductase [Betaproteobacteria bacterium]|nr:dependent oxidoreductase [Betaproteobacteria bacterium]
MGENAQFDLLIIGGGINGAGIARDAAGRGLSVLLVEKDDLAAATSSASSKLIHGGLRYLEQYEFRLVAEALSEREVLLNIAPHLVHPLNFVMPHVPELRPRWMIRAGLYLYDHLARRTRLPSSRGIDLRTSAYGSNLKPSFLKGFVYADCRVDDARLVVANAMAARELGAQILTRTECVFAKRVANAWHANLRSADGNTREVTATALVNAAGPWVKQVLNERLHQPSLDNVRLVKGSHIVVPQLYAGNHAYILQNDDRRVVFMIPYEQRYTLIGTTDIAMPENSSSPTASDEEIAYLCRAANRYLAQGIAPEHVVWSYAGVRPLYDDGTADPSAITRDYTLRLDADADIAPVLSVFGGKITTYRRLAEHALEKLRGWFPAMRDAWTAGTALPGGNLTASFEKFTEVELADRYPWLAAEVRRALASRHGAYAGVILDGSHSMNELGMCFGAELYAREVDYLIEQEWARTAEDILYRRTKAGLHLNKAQCGVLESYVATRIEKTERP